MTEQPDAEPQSSDDEHGSHASVGQDPPPPEGGRTEAETTVDEALGQGTAPGE
jgi:hypothetical protein